MLQVEVKLAQPEPAQAQLTLPFELRQKSRLRATLDDGREVALVLPRGQILRGGDCLRAEEGTVIQVQAALELVSVAYSDDPLLLARACYHLGNRHIALQIGAGWCRYLHDHVLDTMVSGLGLRVQYQQLTFEPEAGAYEGHQASVHASAHAHAH